MTSPRSLRQLSRPDDDPVAKNGSQRGSSRTYRVRITITAAEAVVQNSGRLGAFNQKILEELFRGA
jgi:hypothetical protein